MLGTLLALFALGIAGIVVVSIVLAVVGIAVSMAFGLLGFLLFKVAPVLLIGWVVLKLIDRSNARRRLSSGDRRWLDS